MTKFKRVDASNLDFLELVGALDSYLSFLDGKDHQFNAQ